MGIPMHLSKPLVIQGYTQNYDWGMSVDSLVGKFSQDKNSSPQYAELWFGDHINGPSYIPDLQQNLRELIDSEPENILGGHCIRRYGTHLPFLFKILSVGSALSIQAHPDPDLAQVLHEKDPEHYRDPFPKPEIGIALSDVELLYGFQNPDVIKATLREVPEFAILLAPRDPDYYISASSSDAVFLENIYTAVMTASPEQVTQASTALFSRLHNLETLSPEESWILELEKKYPAGDIGLFSFYLLNLVKVPTGSALFIGPNIPHAYLRNELAECMAPSDNVVRAGLTSKYIDTETLLAMLTYAYQPPELLSTRTIENHSQAYREFATPESDYFRVGVLENSAAPEHFQTGSKIELLFSLAGITRVNTDLPHTLDPGSALIIPATLSKYSVYTSGTVFRIRTP